MSFIGGAMFCTSCGSFNLDKFIAEMGIRRSGLKNLDRSVVWVFPQIIVCLDCGKAEFVVPKPELRGLARDDSAVAG